VTESTPLTILVVDDDDAYRAQLSRALERRGFRVVAAANAGAANDLARAHPVTFASVDLRMPGGSGLGLVRTLRELRPALVVVVVTGYGSIATALDAVRLGATHYLTKPVDASALLAAFAGATRGMSAPAEVEVPSLARTEWEHIHRVLSDCDGNISQAARMLRIQRKSLQRKLAKYPVPK
jgi:two-component system, response regulator RegA